MDLVKALSDQYLKPELPEINVGDTVRVSLKVKEGNRERIQVFEGIVIAQKVFPIHSPNIASIETVRRGKVRRAKLHYLRDRVGKKAKVKEKL